MMFLALVMPGFFVMRAQAETPDAGGATKTAASQPLNASAFAQLPFVEKPVISPSGDRLAGLMAVQGRQIITMMNIFEKDEKAVHTGLADTVQVDSLMWVNDDHLIVTVQVLDNVNGQGLYVRRAIAISRLTGKITKLLWDQGGQDGGDIIWVPSDGSRHVLIAAQNSIFIGSDFWRAVYRVDVATGAKTMVQKGVDGVLGWTADATGKVRGGLAYRDDTRTFRLLYRGEGQGSNFRTVDRGNTRNRETVVRPFLFLPGGDHALAIHDNDKGNGAIYEIDLASLQDVKLVYEAPDGEVEDVILSGDGRTLLGATTTSAKEGVHWLDAALAELQEQFDKAVPGAMVRIESMNRDRTKMIVRVSAADTAGQIYFYDVAVGRLQRLAAVNDALGPRRLSPVKVIRYKARDGLEIEGILTLPKGRDHRNLPLIVMPHGGPWARDTLTYDYWAQFIANLGYAVLQPNFRGSTGYGTEFLRRGEGQLGLAMQDDVTDAVHWAAKDGIADPKRVCIVGASYGGYAAMWGITKDPDLYRCAISIAGVSNLRREVNDFGGYLMGNKFRDDWQRMTPDFIAVSPYRQIARIKTPLLLIHGKKDITVNHSQSASMNSRMVEAGKDVEFLSLPLADHYYSREADRLALLNAIEKFLAKHNPPN
jgi:dipeptidyl aminopeptidase/acylaminoacyl peptidase